MTGLGGINILQLMEDSFIALDIKMLSILSILALELLVKFPFFFPLFFQFQKKITILDISTPNASTTFRSVFAPSNYENYVSLTPFKNSFLSLAPYSSTGDLSLFQVLTIYHFLFIFTSYLIDSLFLIRTILIFSGV